MWKFSGNKASTPDRNAAISKMENEKSHLVTVQMADIAVGGVLSTLTTATTFVWWGVQEGSLLPAAQIAVIFGAFVAAGYAFLRPFTRLERGALHKDRKCNISSALH